MIQQVKMKQGSKTDTSIVVTTLSTTKRNNY